MLSLFAFVSLFLFGDNLTFIFGQNSIEDAQRNWTKYTNQTYGFTFEYPSFWIVKENSNKDKEIIDLEIGPLSKNILSEKFTAHFAFRSFGQSEFGTIPIDDINIITDIVKYMVKKIITDKYNLTTTILNDVEIQKLNGNSKEIGTFTFLVGDRKDIIITTIVTNHNNNTIAFFLLGTVSQFENPKFIQDLKHIINSIRFINMNSKIEELPTSKQEVTPIINILEDASVQGYPNYDPKELTVKRGATIIINNNDIMPHTVTNGIGPIDSESGKVFATNIIKGGDSYELKIGEIDYGKYPYYCSIHPYMTGTLIIQ
ncbi:MAG: plastocyanin/azurin family copper-binding protein [Deltaproteobacteria bacterium]